MSAQKIQPEMGNMTIAHSFFSENKRESYASQPFLNTNHDFKQKPPNPPPFDSVPVKSHGKNKIVKGRQIIP
jgi:hypothetical protein